MEPLDFVEPQLKTTSFGIHFYSIGPLLLPLLFPKWRVTCPLVLNAKCIVHVDTIGSDSQLISYLKLNFLGHLYCHELLSVLNADC